MRVRGEIEKEDGVLVIRRIHVTHQLKVPDDRHDAVERVLDVYAAKCPVARSIGGSVEISSSVEYA